MQDILLNRTMRLTVVGTIAAVAFASLILLYRALFDLLTAEWPDAMVKGIWGTAAAAGALLLMRYRNDLIDT